MSPPEVLLVDNGSVAAPAIRRLREIARALAARIGEAVAPVSMLHSSTVDPQELGGVRAEILAPALARRIAEGRRDFLVVPLFFGPSGGITEYLPAVVRTQQEKTGPLAVRVAAPLFQPDDPRLAGILANHVRAVTNAGAAQQPARVALVDHGSPARAVVAVRDALARQLAEMLGSGYGVAASSMERRPGPEFAFGEPLLESVLRRPGWRDGTVTVAMQFLLPGRHAGPDGDVARIGRAAAEEFPDLRIHTTPLVGESPALIDILADRWQSGRESAPLK
jgi:hypothetical protein